MIIKIRSFYCTKWAKILFNLEKVKKFFLNNPGFAPSLTIPIPVRLIFRVYCVCFNVFIFINFFPQNLINVISLKKYNIDIV